MKKTEIFKRASKISTTPIGRLGYLTGADGLEFLSDLKNEIASILFLDPPFNLRKDYGKRCDLESASRDVYLHYFEKVFAEGARVLRPGGALFLYHLPHWALILGNVLEKHLSFRHWIAIAMKNGFARGDRLYPAHYALLYYTKGDPASFRRPKIKPIHCRHCGGYVKDYGGYTSIIEEKGLNLSDYWEDLSPVRHRSKKSRPANELPRELTDRVVRIAGETNGVLIDPFCGSGTSLVSARDGGMRFVGNDFARRNLSTAVKRLTGHG